LRLASLSCQLVALPDCLEPSCQIRWGSYHTSSSSSAACAMCGHLSTISLLLNRRSRALTAVLSVRLSARGRKAGRPTSIHLGGWVCVSSRVVRRLDGRLVWQAAQPLPTKKANTTPEEPAQHKIQKGGQGCRVKRPQSTVPDRQLIRVWD
jgi:hypothetical protein